MSIEIIPTDFQILHYGTFELSLLFIFTAFSKMKMMSETFAASFLGQNLLFCLGTICNTGMKLKEMKKKERKREEQKEHTVRTL